MNINPKNGVDELLFGMKQNHVEHLLGIPNKKFKDEDQNIIYMYNEQKLRLTFYEDEAFRLGYIVVSNSDATLFDKKLIGRSVKEVIEELPVTVFKTWETADEDGIETVFNEDNWLIFISEFDTITKIEVGALIENDEFVWKFKG
ncbi:hypothetical protein LZZ90_13470 [Flavobacterium sp. SM15]|uniref:hypothetical protein n=1 Tax=Flavobacterium sp. SM15 TaxID=2908005 RepID=UPI001EDB7343|nr:hypothetical protein [Flavobacterium sp. SM15]MCG2612519.1 hypothetical protein [Flavobacterium sp. SM15]